MIDLTIFGRQWELGTLHSAITDAADGVGGCTVVTGPAGIGKSHLLRTAIEYAAELGVARVHFAATELDRAAPLITLASTLRRIEPETQSFDWLRQDQIDPYRRVERLVEAFEEYTAACPLVVAIDDAQWIDELSALAVARLITGLTAAPVRWLMARRPVPADTPGGRLVDALARQDTAQIELRRLDEDAVARLCAQLAGAEVDHTVLALASGCNGVPLLIVQLMRSLRMTGQLIVSDGVATVVGGELPSSFVTVIDQMVGGLTVDTQRMVRAASVLGRPFSVDALARLLGVRPTALLPQIAEATRADLLVDSADGLTFNHQEVRLAIYDAMGPAARTVHHREAAKVAHDEGRSPVEVAEHLIKGGRSTNEAVGMLREAARQVRDAAPSTAADLILSALDVLAESDPLRPRLIADAVGLLAASSRLDAAHRLGEAALHAGLDPPTEATLLLGLAEAFKHAGQNRTAVEYADRAIRLANLPDATRGRLLAIRAHAQFYMGDLAGADSSAAAAHDAQAATEVGAAAVFGLAARSLVAQAQGRLADSLAYAQQATDIADRVKGEAAHRHPRIWLSNALLAADRFDEAESALGRGRAESERLGTAWSTPLWHYYNTSALIARGQLDDAHAEATTGVSIADGSTAVQLAVPLLGMLIRISVLRDDLEQAHGHRADMRRRMATGVTAAAEDVVWAEGMLLDATDGADAAMAVLAGLYDTLPDRPVLISQEPAAAATLVRIATRADDQRRARLVVTAARGLAGRNPQVRSLVAAAAQADGVLRSDPRALRTAVDEFRRTPRRTALAGALADAALTGPDDPDREDLAEEAARIATDIGAHRIVARLAGRFRGGRGLDGGRVGSRLDKLTSAERVVALEIGKGTTNRDAAKKLYLSRHTVDSHLRKIFIKLGVRRRAELARLIAEDLRDNPGST
ncbi:helix-turn-helix transcriptional regulator [Solwaraspora sp. WMMB335]|uniref:helix-turn-helix transcriptional regulator n=1 Tax=Solwaraspora sp. WMMB335 TaxID=3404118 RepID=UPI003B9407D9